MNVRRSILVVVLLAGVCAVLATSAWQLRERPAGGLASAERHVAPDRRTERALRILHAWDDARARAYATGDVAALRRLYVPNSVSGDRDAGWLQQYADTGLVVEDLRTQLLSAEVASWHSGHLDLIVTDRLAGAVAVDREGVRYPLPRDLATTLTVSFVHHPSGWLVREASL